MSLMAVLSIIISFLLIVLLVRSFLSGKGLTVSEIQSLKNELTDLKTKQLEAQNKALLSQQTLFNDTQRLMSEQLHALMGTVNESLTKNQGNINTQLTSANTMLNDVHKKLGILETTAHNMENIGKDISSLQEILQAPKLRGNLGEFMLEELLKQMFPKNNYQMKYSFRNGTQVDAIIRLGDNIIPIDSKFPLESFKRMLESKDDEQKKLNRKEFVKSVKGRIDEIAKYINPGEGTYDFAMMYISAENVFYEVIVNDEVTEKSFELLNYGMAKHVVPVSPNSFYAYLMAIAYGLRGFKLEAQTKVIIGELTNIQRAFAVFYEDLVLLGKHISNASGKYEDSLKRADKFNDKVGQVTGVNMELPGPGDDEKKK